MEWYADGTQYDISSDGMHIKKTETGHKGIVGKCLWLSAGPHEFRICGDYLRRGLYVGVADSTPDDVSAGTTAQALVVSSSGDAYSCTAQNGIDLCGVKTKRQVRAGAGSVAAVNVRVEASRLHASIDGEQYIDLGFDLPEKVAPWVCMYQEGDECAFQLADAQSSDSAAVAPSAGAATCQGQCAESDRLRQEVARLEGENEELRKALGQKGDVEAETPQQLRDELEKAQRELNDEKAQTWQLKAELKQFTAKAEPKQLMKKTASRKSIGSSSSPSKG